MVDESGTPSPPPVVATSLPVLISLHNRSVGRRQNNLLPGLERADVDSPVVGSQRNDQGVGMVSIFSPFFQRRFSVMKSWKEQAAGNSGLFLRWPFRLSYSADVT